MIKHRKNFKKRQKSHWNNIPTAILLLMGGIGAISTAQHTTHADTTNSNPVQKQDSASTMTQTKAYFNRLNHQYSAGFNSGIMKVAQSLDANPSINNDTDSGVNKGQKHSNYNVSNGTSMQNSTSQSKTQSQSFVNKININTKDIIHNNAFPQSQSIQSQSISTAPQSNVQKAQSAVSTTNNTKQVSQANSAPSLHFTKLAQSLEQPQSQKQSNVQSLNNKSKATPKSIKSTNISSASQQQPSNQTTKALTTLNNKLNHVQSNITQQQPSTSIVGDADNDPAHIQQGSIVPIKHLYVSQANSKAHLLGNKSEREYEWATFKDINADREKHHLQPLKLLTATPYNRLMTKRLHNAAIAYNAGHHAAYYVHGGYNKSDMEHLLQHSHIPNSFYENVAEVMKGSQYLTDDDKPEKLVDPTTPAEIAKTTETLYMDYDHDHQNGHRHNILQKNAKYIDIAGIINRPSYVHYHPENYGRGTGAMAEDLYTDDDGAITFNKSAKPQFKNDQEQQLYNNIPGTTEQKTMIYQTLYDINYVRQKHGVQPLQLVTSGDKYDATQNETNAMVKGMNKKISQKQVNRQSLQNQKAKYHIPSNEIVGNNTDDGDGANAISSKTICTDGISLTNNLVLQQAEDEAKKNDPKLCSNKVKKIAIAIYNPKDMLNNNSWITMEYFK